VAKKMPPTVIIRPLPANNGATSMLTVDVRSETTGNWLAKGAPSGTGFSPHASKVMRPTVPDDQFSTLLEENKGIIYRIANSYCRKGEDRKDLIQAITLQLWRSQSRYDARFKLSTWVYRIALNVAISAYRRDRRRGERVTPLDEVIVEPATETEQPDPRI